MAGAGNNRQHDHVKRHNFSSGFGDTVVRMDFFDKKLFKLALHLGSLYMFLNGVVNLITAFRYWKNCCFNLSMKLGGNRISFCCEDAVCCDDRKPRHFSR
jgi:hypothetical protein